MKKTLPILCAFGLLLGGCGQNSVQEISIAEETTTAMTTVTTLRQQPLATEPETLAPETTEATTAPAATETAPQTSSREIPFEPPITTQSAVTTRLEGGQGGEAHADEPDPLYFNYRFAPDSFSMRLAGGNYQTIYYNLAEAVEHEVEALYTLEDFNFDGNPDLCIPVQGFDTANVQYAVFFWEPEMKRFEKKPYRFVNPVCCADTKEIITLEQLQESGSNVCNVQVYEWKAGINTLVPKITRIYTGDFSELTLSEYDLEGESPETPAVTDYDSKEALEQAVLKIYLHT